MVEYIQQLDLDGCEKICEMLKDRLGVLVKGYVILALKQCGGEIIILNGNYWLSNSCTNVKIKTVKFTDDKAKDYSAKLHGERYLHIKVNERRFEPLVRNINDWLVLYRAIKNNINFQNNIPQKYKAIVFYGYNAYIVRENHRGEKHTAQEWYNIYFTNVSGCNPKILIFNTRDELKNTIKNIRNDRSIPSIYCQINGITDSLNNLL